MPAGLVFSYPCRSDGKGNLTVVEGVKLDAFGQQKFQATLKELWRRRRRWRRCCAASRDPTGERVCGSAPLSGRG